MTRLIISNCVGYCEQSITWKSGNEFNHWVDDVKYLVTLTYRNATSVDFATQKSYLQIILSSRFVSLISQILLLPFFA
jgi:hypothetical protein